MIIKLNLIKTFHTEDFGEENTFFLNNVQL